MKRGEYGPHTRGQWKYNEMAWAVLALLDVAKRSGFPPLTVKAIQRMVGCNYKSLILSLPKWTGFGWVKRHEPRQCRAFVKPVYTYSITGKGKHSMFKMEMPRQRGLFKFKPGVVSRSYIDAVAIRSQRPQMRGFTGTSSKLLETLDNTIFVLCAFSPY